MRKLYEEAKEFEMFLEEGKLEDKETTQNYLKAIDMDDELRNKIKAIKEKYNILVLGEIWCPDCMINIPALEKINRINDNIDFRIIPREGNEDKFKEYEVEGKVKIPTIIIMDSEYKKLGSIVERPQVLKDIYNRGDQVEIIKSSKVYREGGYILSMIEEIVNILIDGE